MSKQVTVKPSQGFRETEVTPFPIGETPQRLVRPPVADAPTYLRAGVPPFEFRSGPHASAAARVASLEAFVDALAVVPADTLEFGLYGGGMERWIGDAVGDGDLRREFAGVRAVGRHGEALRPLLYTVAKTRLHDLTLY